MPEFPKDALIAWEGDSKEVISSFPDEAKQNLGFQLRLLQQGQQPDGLPGNENSRSGSFRAQRSGRAGMVSRDLSVKNPERGSCAALL